MLKFLKLKFLKKENSNQMAKLGRYLKGVRENSKMSIRSAATITNISPAFLSQIESGKAYRTIGIDTIIRLSKIYKIPLLTILREAGFTESGLPEFAQYLRAKYHFSNEAVKSMETILDITKRKYRKPNFVSRFFLNLGKKFKF